MKTSNKVNFLRERTRANNRPQVCEVSNETAFKNAVSEARKLVDAPCAHVSKNLDALISEIKYNYAVIIDNAIIGLTTTALDASDVDIIDSDGEGDTLYSYYIKLFKTLKTELPLFEKFNSSENQSVNFSFHKEMLRAATEIAAADANLTAAIVGEKEILARTSELKEPYADCIKVLISRCETFIESFVEINPELLSIHFTNLKYIIHYIKSLLKNHRS